MHLQMHSRKYSYIAFFYYIIGLLHCTDFLCPQIIVDQHKNICSTFPWHHIWRLNSMLTYNEIEGFKSIVIMFFFFVSLELICI